MHDIASRPSTCRMKPFYRAQATGVLNAVDATHARVIFKVCFDPLCSLQVFTCLWIFGCGFSKDFFWRFDVSDLECGFGR